MKALVYQEELRFEPEYPTPDLPAGEALVRVVVAGICNTDLELVRGYMAFRGVPGHEFVGVVEDAEDGSWVGRRVVGEINAACYRCPTCLSGSPTHCPHRTVLGIQARDGAFAEYLRLPVANLHPVPDAITDEQAVFVEPLAAALEIFEQVRVRPTDRVAVVGDGKLGLLVAQALSLVGCDLVAIGRHPNKLVILAQRGVNTTLADQVGGLVVDVVVECTGHPSGFALARSVLRPRGTLVAKSTYHGNLEVNWSMLVVDEISVIGSRCGPFEPALRLLERGLIEVNSMIHAEYSLSRGVEAFEKAQEPGVLKVLIRP